MVGAPSRSSVNSYPAVPSFHDSPRSVDGETRPKSDLASTSNCGVPNVRYASSNTSIRPSVPQQKSPKAPATGTDGIAS